MYKFFKIILFLGMVAASWYVFREPVASFVGQVYQKVLPCQKPITYSINSFDERFGISREDFLLAINEAAQIWEKPLGRKLFELDLAGDLKINLVYDYRQEATDKIRQMGLTISDDKSSYEALRERHKNLQADYVSLKSAFDLSVTGFQLRQDTYNNEVARWNKAGGAPQEIFDRLNEEKAALRAEAAKLNQLQGNLNSQVEKINALVVILNRLVATLNLEAAQYNEINRQTSGEFQQGVYERGPNGQAINIYQFDNADKLLRVLAHELGHALGLDHLENPAAIMYKMNEGMNKTLTQDDLEALKAICRIR